ncbi:MAG TPA: ATP-grasp domain-containing protein [Gemmatimonadaceae bacterium]
MKVVLLHTADAAESDDPVLGQLEEALAAQGHATARVVVSDALTPFVEALGAAAPDLVWNLAEAFGGKSALESNVAAVLSLLGLHYTGSSPAGLLLAGDKVLAKKILRFHGIRSPEFATLYRGAVEWAGELAFPLIVKPPQEDASIGITTGSVVHDLRELLVKLDEVHSEFRSPALVEQFVEGREFYVGVLGNAHAEALPVIELDFSRFPAGTPRVASWDAKWGDASGGGAEFGGTESVFPTDLPAELVVRMQKVAVDAFEALRLRDYGRIDLRVSPEGEIFVIEVNPNCYLERGSEFARAAHAHGLPYDQLVERIVDLAMARYAR